MNVNIENLSSVKSKISFEIPADRVTSEIGKVYEQIRKCIY
jgi:trigger factor